MNSSLFTSWLFFFHLLGQSVSFECNIDYDAIVEPILEVANKTFNIQSTFSRDLEDQDKTVDDLKINVERLPDVIGQIVDPIIQASNQGTVPNSTLYVYLCSTSKYIHTSINHHSNHVSIYRAKSLYFLWVQN